MKVILVLVLGFSGFGGTGQARAEMLGQSSVDHPTCCESCKIMVNCFSKDGSFKAPVTPSASKSGGPGTAAEAQ